MAEVPYIDRCDCNKPWEFICGKQVYTNVIPIALRSIISFLAFIIISGYEVVMLAWAYFQTALNFSLMRRILWGIIILYALYEMQEHWPQVAKTLRWVLPVIEAIINFFIMLINFAITLYGIFARIWNMLVPFLGMILYLFFELFLTICKLMGSFFGGANAANAMASRNLLFLGGLGDALGGIFEIVMKLISIYMEIYLEFWAAVLKIQAAILMALANIIGAIVSFVMIFVKIFFEILSFLIEVIFMLLRPIIFLIIALFGGGGNAHSQNLMSGMASSRNLLSLEEMFNKPAMERRQERDDARTNERRVNNEGGVEYDPNIFVSHFMRGAQEFYVEGSYDGSLDLADKVIAFHRDPNTIHMKKQAMNYEKYNQEDWMNPDISPLKEQERKMGAVKRLRMEVGHPMLVNNPELEKSITMHLMHATRKTFSTLGEHVFSGQLRKNVDRLAQSAGFLSSQHAAEHFTTVYKAPEDIIQDLSPSMNDDFMTIARFIDPDHAERRFFGDFQQANSFVSPSTGERYLMMINMDILTRTDCYSSDPRNPLCLPEFPKGFKLCKVNLDMPFDINDDKACPHYAPTSSVYSFYRVWNAIITFRTILSLFVPITIVLYLIGLRYPIFGFFVDLILLYPAGQFPPGLDIVCAFIYFYDLYFLVIMYLLFRYLVFPFLMFLYAISSHFTVHKGRMSAWADSDMERWLRPDKMWDSVDSSDFPVQSMASPYAESSDSWRPASWHRTIKSKYLDVPKSSMVIRSIGSDIESSNSLHSKEFRNAISSFETTLNKFSRHFGPADQKHDYIDTVVRGRFFGVIHTLENLPMHVYSIVFILDFINVFKGNKSAHHGVLKQHIKEIVDMAKRSE